MNETLECGIWDRQGTCLVALDDLAPLPLYHRETIINDYLDPMGHMNIRWYLTLFDRAAWKFIASFGMDADYFQSKQAGSFALKQFIQYFAEVRVGQTVSIRTRFIDRSDKRFHVIHFMTNESTGQLSASLEVLGTYADLKLRRSAPFPADIAEKMDTRLNQDQRLSWDAPLCGVIHV